MWEEEKLSIEFLYVIGIKLFQLSCYQLKTGCPNYEMIYVGLMVMTQKNV